MHMYFRVTAEHHYHIKNGAISLSLACRMTMMDDNDRMMMMG